MKIEFSHDAGQHSTSLEVVPPYFAHRIRDRRGVRILQRDSCPFYGGMSLTEAEKLHDALGKAIVYAKTLKMVRPSAE